LPSFILGLKILLAGLEGGRRLREQTNCAYVSSIKMKVGEQFGRLITVHRGAPLKVRHTSSSIFL